MIKLATESKQLPPSLFVSGINLGETRDPLSAGTFADVFRGELGGHTVALKRLRMYKMSQADVHKVSTSYAFSPMKFTGIH